MRRYVYGTMVALMATTLAITLGAQKTTTVHPGKGGSPHVRSEWTVDGAAISIEYGRPSLKGRTVGKDVAAYGKPWRTGADEATTLKTDKPLKFGTLAVPAGTYTIYTLPREDAFTLIVNEATDVFHTVYDPGRDFGHVPTTRTTLEGPPVEQLTFVIAPRRGGGGTLELVWDDRKYGVEVGQP